MKNKENIISIVGPESTGKTALAGQLAAHFNGAVVPEFARNFLKAKDGKYEQTDLTTIAHGQLQTEQKIIRENDTLIFCDTDILVVLIWHQFKYRKSCKELEEMFHSQPERKYLLLYPDLPWKADPLRENPNDLVQIFDMYERALKLFGATYKVVRGTEGERTENAISAVKQLNEEC